jgi:hypothetical protein
MDMPVFMTNASTIYDFSSLKYMTLFFHNKARKSDGGVEMIKTAFKVISNMCTILFSSIIGICHLVILIFLGLIGLITGICTLLMPIFGLLRAFGTEKIFIIWDDFHVPAILGLPTGIFLGMICASISWLCFRAFMKYFFSISRNKHDMK